MEPNTSASVAEQLARVEAALGAVKQQINAERQKAKDERKRKAKAWRLTDWLTHVVLIVYMLSGREPEPAVQFLAEIGRKRRWPQKEDEELKVMVEDLFLGVDLVVLTDLCNLAQPSDPSAAEVAVRVTEEWRLVQWVQRLNDHKGVAPTTEMVLARLEEHRLQVPEASRPGHRGTSADGHARAWARRWRMRWGARYGKIRSREEMPLHEMQAKARPVPKAGGQARIVGRRPPFRGQIQAPLCRAGGPIFGARFRPHFWVRNPAPYINPSVRGRCGPISGSGFWLQKWARLGALF